MENSVQKEDNKLIDDACDAFGQHEKVALCTPILSKPTT